MAMKKALGSELQTGVISSGISGLLEQSATRSKLGELKEYKDKDGKTVSVYMSHDAASKREEISFDTIVKANVDRAIGDVIRYNGKKAVILKWDVVESNDDVKKVSLTIRTYPDV